MNLKMKKELLGINLVIKIEKNKYLRNAYI